jgi:hypothetical protein
MDPLTIVSTISTVIKVAQAAVQAGKDAAPFIKAIYNTFAGKTEVTQADLDKLIAESDRLRVELHLPLPPPEEGEPE